MQTGRVLVAVGWFKGVAGVGVFVGVIDVGLRVGTWVEVGIAEGTEVGIGVGIAAAIITASIFTLPDPLCLKVIV